VKLSPEQSIAARKLLGWSQSDLAYVAGVRELSVSRFEARTRQPWGATIGKLRKAFVEVGVVFVGDVGVAPTLKDSAHRATIVREPNGVAAEPLRKQFRSLRAALHYYVLRLSREERDATHILTAHGRRWGRSELLALPRAMRRRTEEE
jgi:transcriptional regulator with XRE-family HTH domain